MESEILIWKMKYEALNSSLNEKLDEILALRLNKNLSQPETEPNIDFQPGHSEASNGKPVDKSNIEKTNEKANTNGKTNQKNTGQKLKSQTYEKTVYSVHVSKFPIGTSPGDISTIILEKSKIDNPDVFKIETMRTKIRFWNKKFVSFKISTLQKEYYDVIIEKNLWGPEHTVRDFEDRSGMKHIVKSIDEKVPSKTKKSKKPAVPEPKQKKSDNVNKLKNVKSHKQPKHHIKQPQQINNNNSIPTPAFFPYQIPYDPFQYQYRYRNIQNMYPIPQYPITQHQIQQYQMPQYQIPQYQMQQYQIPQYH